MSLRRLKTLFALVLVFCFLGTGAQMLPYPYGPAISVDNAKKAAAAALAEAVKNHWAMAVAVVDPNGTLIYYEKMDNTQLGSAEVAVEKARSAARFKRPTKAFQGAVPIEGGIPLIIDTKDGKMIIGAIGLSGDTSEHDGQCATVGAALIK